MAYCLIQADARHIPIPNESVHLVITSPPYFNARNYALWATYDDYLSDMFQVWKECFRVLINGGRIAVNVLMGYGRPGESGGYKPMEVDTSRSLLKCGFELRGHIIWVKPGIKQSGRTAWGSWLSASNPSLREGHEVIIIAHKGSAGRGSGKSTITREEFLVLTSTVWNIQPQTASWHPAPFPDEIPRRLIQLYSFQSDTILDPFSGSGTTIRVAGQCGRHAIGLDTTYEYLSAAYSNCAAAHHDWGAAQQHFYKAQQSLADLRGESNLPDTNSKQKTLFS